MSYQEMKHGDPEGAHWAPAMSDAPLRGHAGRHEWFWEPEDEQSVYPLMNLVDMYERSVGHNSTLIMGLTPDPRGRMPEVDTRRCIEWGREIRRRYGAPLARTSGTGKTLTLELPEPRTLDRVVIREHIEQGHRVRGYALHGLTATGDWEELGAGTCIGNRRIHPVEPVQVAEVRLTITKIAGRPTIDDLSAYRVG
jgi:alpha-L-fucosidase